MLHYLTVCILRVTSHVIRSTCINTLYYYRVKNTVCKPITIQIPVYQLRTVTLRWLLAVTACYQGRHGMISNSKSNNQRGRISVYITYRVQTLYIYICGKYIFYKIKTVLIVYYDGQQSIVCLWIVYTQYVTAQERYDHYENKQNTTCNKPP